MRKFWLNVVNNKFTAILIYFLKPFNGHFLSNAFFITIHSPVSIISLSVGIDFIASILASVFKELKHRNNDKTVQID